MAVTKPKGGKQLKKTYATSKNQNSTPTVKNAKTAGGAGKDQAGVKVERAKTAWMYWLADSMASLVEKFRIVKEENIEKYGIKGAFMRFASEQWNLVEDRSEWEECATEDRLRYKRQMEWNDS